MDNVNLLSNNTTVNVHQTNEKQQEKTVPVAVSLLILIALLGSAANLLVLREILKLKTRKLHEYLILNLATTDAGTCLISIPLDIGEQLTGEFPYGAVLCHIIYPFQSVLVYVSVMTLLFMCVERFRLIVTPLKPRIRVKTGLTVITAIWFLSCLMVLPLSLVLKLKGSSCSEEWPNAYIVKMFTVIIFILLYLIPVSIMALLYTCTVCVLQKDTRSLKIKRQRGTRTFSQESIDDRLERNYTVVKAFVISVLVFAICMLPTHVTWLWHDFGNGSENPYGLFNKVATFSNILTYTNSLVNPFIFGSIMINFERFVNIFKNFICCRCLRRANDFYEIQVLQLRSPSMLSQLANRSFFLSLSKPSDISSFEINEVVKATKITTKDHNSFATIFP